MDVVRNIIQSEDGEIMYLFFLLCITMIADYVTGTIVAYINKEQNSKIGTNGILKKCLIFITTVVLMVCSVLIPTGNAFIIVTLFGLVGMQLQSIAENCKKVNLVEGTYLKVLYDLLQKRK